VSSPPGLVDEAMVWLREVEAQVPVEAASRAWQQALGVAWQPGLCGMGAAAEAYLRQVPVHVPPP
jgi:hypothetical protein